MTKLFLSLVAFGVLAACGNPVKLQNDLTNEKNKRIAADNRAQADESDDRRIKGLFKDIFVTQNNVWVPDIAKGDYQTAKSACESIGYSLPDQTAFDEFVAESYSQDPDWKRQALGDFHILDKTTALASGWAICRMALKH